MDLPKYCLEANFGHFIPKSQVESSIFSPVFVEKQSFFNFFTQIRQIFQQFALVNTLDTGLMQIQLFSSVPNSVPGYTIWKELLRQKCLCAN